MDVELPNGIIIRGVPEGTTRSQIAFKAIIGGLAKPEDFGQKSLSDPTEGMSGFQKFRAGYGKSAVDLGRGVTQTAASGLFGTAPAILARASGFGSREAIAESRRRDAPLMNTGAGIAGNISGSVANLLPTAAIPGANTIAGSAAIGGGIGLLQPSTSGRETAKNVGLGAGIAAAFPAAAAALRSGGSAVARPETSDAFRAAVGALDEAKVPLTTGQRLGSQPVKSLETTMGDTFLGGSIRNTMQRGRAALQSNLMRMAGFSDEAVKSGAVTRDALDETAERFSARYTEALGDKVVRLNSDDVLKRLGEIEATQSKFLGVQQKVDVTNAIGDMIDQALSSPLTGKQYQMLRSDLGRKAESLKLSSPFQSSVLKSLRSVLDDAFADAAGPQVAATKRGIDLEYGRFKTLKNVFERTGGEQASQGVLPLASVAREASKRPDRAFERLSRAGSAVLGGAGPNSGTPSRLINAMIGGGVGAGTMIGNPMVAGTAVGIPYILSQLLSRGITGAAATRGLSRLGIPVSSGTNRR